MESIVALTMPPRDSLDPAMRLQLARWLDRYLSDSGWTQRKLAGKLGISEAHLSRLLGMLRKDEREEVRFIGIDTFIAMRERLHMDLNAVIDGDPPPQKKEPLRVGAPSQPPARRHGS